MLVVMLKQSLSVVGFGALALYVVWTRLPADARRGVAQPVAHDPHCHGPRNLSLEQIEAAQTDGKPLNMALRCVDRVALDAANTARAQAQARLRAESVQNSAAVEHLQRQERMSLEQARAGHQTAWTAPALSQGHPLPTPPPAQFVRSDYASGDLRLAGYLSKVEGTEKRRPAIVWITGGDYQALDDSFWQADQPEHDQTVQAFRRAKVVTYLPTLRGGNTGGGGGAIDFGYGEVDDVLAAASHLAKLPGVDPERIYLGGMSTGASLALLVAGMGEPARRFKAVFALGPKADGFSMPSSVTQREGTDPELERKLRTPHLWLHAATQPVHVMEGLADTSDQDLKRLCQASNRQLQCHRLGAVRHSQLVAAVAPRIAAGLVQAQLLGGDFAMPDLSELSGSTR